MNTGLLHALGGVNLICGMGNLGGTHYLSDEALVVDNDIAGRILHSQRGIQFDDESLAVPVIEEFGPKADYLGHAHTLKHFREEIHMPTLLSRTSRERWQERGALTLKEAAAARAEEILAEPFEPQLTDHQSAELHRIEDSWRKQICP